MFTAVTLQPDRFEVAKSGPELKFPDQRGKYQIKKKKRAKFQVRIRPFSGIKRYCCIFTQQFIYLKSTITYPEKYTHAGSLLPQLPNSSRTRF
eukprot:TRINITY_DN20141_c0_g1_i1.p3 TRINITY_DN20141_c0_g1~~TRINITY_DN20141_c0_g1_i1.p3  ORF type:complete len:106 (+),score=2.38 TRINITY_DN20141_c0_g1_i1:42-320(+)